MDIVTLTRDNSGKVIVTFLYNPFPDVNVGTIPDNGGISKILEVFQLK